MNYTDLETAIQNYCETDEISFVAEINTFIKNAEDKIFEALKGPLYWNVDTSGTMVVNQAEYTIANGVIDVLDFYVVGPNVNTDGAHLEQRDHSFLREAYPQKTGSTVSGFPRFYALQKSLLSSGEPGVQVRVAPAPNAAYKFNVAYYGKSTTDTITDGATPGGGSTNETWVSVVYPDVLLHGALANAYVYLKGDREDIDRYEKRFNDGLLLLKNMSEARIETDVASSSSAPKTEGI